jgi:hypothetical protein
VNQSFSLDPSKDLDIIKWLGQQKDVSEAIKKAIRYVISDALTPSEREPTLIETLLQIKREMNDLNKTVNEKMLLAAENLEKVEVKQGRPIPEEILNNLKGLKV